MKRLLSVFIIAIILANTFFGVAFAAQSADYESKKTAEKKRVYPR